jgi:hypothetical protein
MPRPDQAHNFAHQVWHEHFTADTETAKALDTRQCLFGRPGTWLWHIAPLATKVGWDTAT